MFPIQPATTSERNKLAMRLSISIIAVTTNAALASSIARVYSECLALGAVFLPRLSAGSLCAIFMKFNAVLAYNGI